MFTSYFDLKKRTAGLARDVVPIADYAVQLHAPFSLRRALPCVDGDVFRHVFARAALSRAVDGQDVVVAACARHGVAVAAARVDCNRVSVSASILRFIDAMYIPIWITSSRCIFSTIINSDAKNTVT